MELTTSFALWQVGSRQNHGYPLLHQGHCCGGEYQFLHCYESKTVSFWLFYNMMERSGSLQSDFSCHIHVTSQAVYNPERVFM